MFDLYFSEFPFLIFLVCSFVFLGLLKLIHELSSLGMAFEHIKVKNWKLS